MVGCFFKFFIPCMKRTGAAHLRMHTCRCVPGKGFSMLEKVDLSKKLSKEEYKSAIDGLKNKLGELQRRARNLGIPVIIVFEGWDAAGKGTMINRLLISMDPRGFTVHPINPPNEEERLRPFLWRFWTKTPERGRIAIFDRSWYGRVLVGRVDKLVKRREWEKAFDEIRSFERQLSDDGTVIIKFFLHISKEEQKSRFKKLQKKSVHCLESNGRRLAQPPRIRSVSNCNRGDACEDGHRVCSLDSR